MNKKVLFLILIILIASGSINENEDLCTIDLPCEENLTSQPTNETNNDLKIPTLISSAFSKSISPCVFPVLIFFLVYLVASDPKKRMLKFGLMYISAVFIADFLAGIGVFTVIQNFSLMKAVYAIAALVAIITGLVNLKDFFFYGKGIISEVLTPIGLLFKKHIIRAKLPAVIILGSISRIAEPSCRGSTYFINLSNNAALQAGIPYLLVYNLISVLPLIVILLVAYMVIPAEEVEKFGLEKKEWLRLLTGGLMIVLGGLLFFWLV